MRRFTALERSISQLASAPASSRHVCRSCKLRAAGLQTRQFQSFAPNRAEAGLTARNNEENLAVQENAQHPKNLKPSKKPEDDPFYVEATTWDNLERIGSDRWVDGQLDPGDRYEGWAPLTRNPRLEAAQVESALQDAAASVLPAESRAALSGEGWRGYRLADPAQKFAIVRALRQELGVNISDFMVNSAKTLDDLRNVLLIKPQPKKVSQQLREKEELKGLPNVKVAARRITPIDKEKAVGRWKIIEQELMERGLPVTGHSGRTRKVNRV